MVRSRLDWAHLADRGVGQGSDLLFRDLNLCLLQGGSTSVIWFLTQMHVGLATVVQLGEDVNVAKLGVVTGVTPREIFDVAIRSFV